MTAPVKPGDIKPVPRGTEPDENWHLCDGATLESMRYPEFVAQMEITLPVFILPTVANQQIYLGEEVEPPPAPAPPAFEVPPGSVHRFWEGPTPPGADWLRTVVESTQDVAPNDWTPATLPDVAKWIPEQFTDPRTQANALRYQLLYTYGGLWLDHDVIPLANLRLRTGPWVASWQAHREGSTMWFPEPNHPMLAELLEVCHGATPSKSTELGGTLLTTVGIKYPDVALEPRVLPLDSAGHPTPGIEAPLAVHLWHTSRSV